MDILNNNQSEIKMRIHSQEEKAENNIKRLEIGIKQTLDQNNDMIGGSINILNQQAQDTQSQMMRLQKDLQQIQHRQFSPERNQRPNIIGFQPQNDDDSTSIDKNKNKKITEALRLLGSGTYNGDASTWFEFKLRIENIIEALDMTKEQSIKFIRLSMVSNAVFISENVKTEPFLQSMNGEALKEYLHALENLFVGSGNKELARVKFTIAKQSHGETVAMWVSRIRTLYKTAFPTEETFENNEIIKDRFIHGLQNIEQRRYVLTARELQDDLTKLTQYASKYEAIQVSLKPDVSSEGFLTTEKKDQINAIQDNRYGRGRFTKKYPGNKFNKNGYQNNFTGYRNRYLSSQPRYLNNNYPRNTNFPRGNYQTNFRYSPYPNYRGNSIQPHSQYNNPPLGTYKPRNYQPNFYQGNRPIQNHNSGRPTNKWYNNPRTNINKNTTSIGREKQHKFNLGAIHETNHDIDTKKPPQEPTNI